jgi:glycosyltransferase involved in cell wall biosynthesis
MDASDYDLVISCSHCVAKGIRRRAGAIHICYCLTPMRYVWSQTDNYRRALSWPSRVAMKALTGRLKAWDRSSASNVDLFIANSRNVAARIREHYGRDSVVVHSPVNTEFFTPSFEPRQEYFLLVTALAPYKRVDQAVAAFATLGLPLRIIGSGPEMRRLRRIAPANVHLMGWQPDEVVRQHYRHCQALVFPGEEDFGIVPLEAAACGAPVIAYAAGGALETVLDVERPDAEGPTGILYAPQTVDGLVAAVRKFHTCRGAFDGRRAAAWAGRFSDSVFLEGFKEAVEPVLAANGVDVPWSSSTRTSP